MASIKIERLRAFVTVAASNSYEDAADKLGLPQPTVWRQVAQLSKELGLELFQPGTVQLTPSGAEMLNIARQMIKDEEELMRLARDLDDGVRGTVKIACYPAHVNRFIADISAQFKRKYPATRIELAPYSQDGTAGQELIDKLRSRDVDLAVGQRRPGEPAFDREGLDGRLAYEVRLVVVLPDDHPDRHRTSLSAESLRGTPLVLPPAGYFTRIQVDRVFRAAGFSPEVAAESGAWMALLAMGRTRVGVPIVPDDALGPEERYPALVDAAGEELIKELWLLWRRDTSNPTVRNFIQLVNSYAQTRTKAGRDRATS
jgi:DNA-binding transcriptional LysR family regulator